MNNFKQIELTHIKALIGTTAQSQAEPSSNGNNGVLHTITSPELKPNHQMQFSVNLTASNF